MQLQLADILKLANQKRVRVGDEQQPSTWLPGFKRIPEQMTSTEWVVAHLPSWNLELTLREVTTLEGILSRIMSP